jgi:3-hydroxyacyl-CoA dehydrogenase
MTSIHTQVHYEILNGVALCHLNNPPVNALGQPTRAALNWTLRKLQDDPEVLAVVIIGSGKMFCAGADISELDGKEFDEPDPSSIYGLIESMAKPVVAAIHGSALGAGLELALSCHFRIATDDTKLGLPEIRLGILPGGGGTQRLPRLIGAKKSIEMMLSGGPISAEESLALGLIDKIVNENLAREAIYFAQGVIACPLAEKSVSRLSVDTSDTTPSYFDEQRMKVSNLAKPALAPIAIIDCVEFAAHHTFEAGLEFERTKFLQCIKTPESKALQHAFFCERAATKLPETSEVLKPQAILEVGIIGAGTMGAGIAMCFANAGIKTTLVDISRESLDRGLAKIASEYTASFKKGKIDARTRAARIGLITGATTIHAIAHCDLVIEAVFEDLQLKTSVCQEMGAVCQTGAILASNTSTLNLDTLAQASGRPESVVGLHFFSPANVMRLLEVVRGSATTPAVLSTVMNLARQIGKVPVVSGVCYGFIGNRMLEGYLRETEALLMEGAAPAQIDNAIQALGFAMGPCRMLDMAGIDVGAKVVVEGMKSGALPSDPAYRLVVRRLFSLGRIGQKSSAGYYRYDGRTPIADPAVRDICARLAEEQQIPQRDEISDAEIVERCLYPLFNEAASILEEGIAQRPCDIDTVWIQGYGFPRHRGGPVYMADAIGLNNIVSRMDHYAQKRGNAYGYWTVSKLLRTVAEGGTRLSDWIR